MPNCLGPCIKKDKEYDKGLWSLFASVSPTVDTEAKLIFLMMHHRDEVAKLANSGHGV